MTIVDPDDVSFVPERVARSRFSDGIWPAEATVVANEFGRCTCGAKLDLSSTNGTREDRDVVWRDGLLYSKPYECEECNGTFNVLVEEKVLGQIHESQIPEDPSKYLFFVPVPETETVLVINTHQIMLHEISGDNS